MLWVKEQMSSGLFTLQQDHVPAHRARETVQLASECTDDRLHRNQDLATQLFYSIQYTQCIMESGDYYKNEFTASPFVI